MPRYAYGHERNVSFAQAKADFPNRYTVENVPAWARQPATNGKYEAPHFQTDKEWYDNTVFPGEPGLHGNARECRTSGETWPLGRWLNAPLKREYNRRA